MVLRPFTQYFFMYFTFHLFNSEHKLNQSDKETIVAFLHEHLDQFGDKQEDILKAIDYSVQDIKSFGGFTLIAIGNNTIVGAVVMNQTGMQGYIPENILVYIATHKSFRGKGIGKQLIQKAVHLSKGDIALHVEPDNPAKYLYQKLGFDHKYLEMRLKNH